MEIFCRKCLIPDYVENKDVFIDTYIGRIEEENRAEDEVYDRRLATCGGCSKYLNGMCRLCGCFVAIRAAGKKQYCPDSPARW